MRKKLIALLKTKQFYYLLALAMLVAFSSYQIASVNQVDHKTLLVLIELLVGGGIAIAYYLLKKKQLPTEKLFLIFAIPLGALFLVFLPPGESPDELHHFKRAYSVTEGCLTAETFDDFGHAGCKLPINIQTSLAPELPAKGTYSAVLEKLSEPVATEKEYSSYNNTALYHWFSYLPQVIGVLLGRLFGASFLTMAYLAEIVDFAVWILLIYLAIKFAPKFKTIILFLSLLPITLQEATSLAPDALAIGLGIFLISYICHLAYVQKSKLAVKQIILLYIMAILVGYCKIVYLPFVLLYLIIPNERFGSAKRKWLHASILAAVLLTLNLTWLSASSQFLVEFNEGVNSSEQVASILHNPPRYAAVLLGSLNHNISFYVGSLLGMTLGSFSFNMPAIFTYLSFAILVLIFAQRHESFKIKSFDRGIFAATFLIISLLIFTSIYVQWSPVGFPYVDGVQGRYFLPILLLVPVFIASRKPRSPQTEIVSQDTILGYSLATNLVALALFFCQNI